MFYVRGVILTSNKSANSSKESKLVSLPLIVTNPLISFWRLISFVGDTPNAVAILLMVSSVGLPFRARVRAAGSIPILEAKSFNCQPLRRHRDLTLYDKSLFMVTKLGKFDTKVKLIYFYCQKSQLQTCFIIDFYILLHWIKLTHKSI